MLHFQRGADRENFELLFRLCLRIERFLASRVFSPEERLDLTQIIFLRIYQGLEGYRGEGSFEGWLLADRLQRLPEAARPSAGRAAGGAGGPPRGPAGAQEPFSTVDFPSASAGSLELAPITAFLGVRPISLGVGEARVELTATERLHNAMTTVHGGIFCDLADFAMGATLATLTTEGESFSTLQLQISYFLPVVEKAPQLPRSGRAEGTGERRISNATSRMEGRAVARATSVCAIL